MVLLSALSAEIRHRLSLVVRYFPRLSCSLSLTLHLAHFLPSKAQRMKISVHRWQMTMTKMRMLAVTSAAWAAGPTPDEQPTPEGRVNANPSEPSARPGSGREGGGGAPPRKRKRTARKRWASVCGWGLWRGFTVNVSLTFAFSSVSPADWCSDMSDSDADKKRRGLRRGQRQDVNYCEVSDSSDNSRASAKRRKVNLHRRHREEHLSSEYSDGSSLNNHYCLDRHLEVISILVFSTQGQHRTKSVALTII